MLEEGVHYVLVPEQVWKKLVEWYLFPLGLIASTVLRNWLSKGSSVSGIKEVLQYSES